VHGRTDRVGITITELVGITGPARWSPRIVDRPKDLVKSGAEWISSVMLVVDSGPRSGFRPRSPKTAAGYFSKVALRRDFAAHPESS
jgi:hypothetical protein